MTFLTLTLLPGLFRWAGCTQLGWNYLQKNSRIDKRGRKCEVRYLTITVTEAKMPNETFKNRRWVDTPKTLLRLLFLRRQRADPVQRENWIFWPHSFCHRSESSFGGTECGPLSESESYLALSGMWPWKWKLSGTIENVAGDVQAPPPPPSPPSSPTSCRQGTHTGRLVHILCTGAREKNILCRGAQTIEQEITLFLTQFKKWFIGSNSSLEMEFRTKQR